MNLKVTALYCVTVTFNWVPTYQTLKGLNKLWLMNFPEHLISSLRHMTIESVPHPVVLSNSYQGTEGEYCTPVYHCILVCNIPPLPFGKFHLLMAKDFSHLWHFTRCQEQFVAKSLKGDLVWETQGNSGKICLGNKIWLFSHFLHKKIKRSTVESSLEVGQRQWDHLRKGTVHRTPPPLGPGAGSFHVFPQWLIEKVGPLAAAQNPPSGPWVGSFHYI